MNAAAEPQVLRELRLRDFRNFGEQRLELPDDGVLIVGRNGSGKTNLLEAIYYLETFRSLRGARDDQLVRFDADGFHLRGRFERGPVAEPREVSVGYDGRTRTKRVMIDGIEAERLGDAIGRACVVAFSPADVTLVSGGPSERRRFLDIVLCLNRRGYLDALQRYRQALKQRNAMLKDGAEAALIEAYDAGLVDAGATVMHERAEWVARHEALFRDRYLHVAGRTAAMRYRPAPRADEAPAERAGWAELLGGALRRHLPRDRERGVTSTGPHRDDVELSLGEEGLDLREYGSGGQQRAAAVALRMVEAETIRRARGVEPIILMDDVFAEFDAERSERVLELMDETERGQVIMTAPKEADVSPRGRSLPRWSIAAGVVSP